MLSKISFLAAIAYAVEPNPPTWDTEHVKIFTPGQADAQATINSILATQGGHVPVNNGQWSDKRYALLFQPGSHQDLNVEIGFYTTVHGLGRTPTDTNLGNLMVQNGDFSMEGGALDNFWRGAENVHVAPAAGTPMLWAVSQASPLRRIHVDGDLQLFQYNAPNPGAGYASGGYLSDSLVTGSIASGSQQQWFTRNTQMQKWASGVWNMVFVGSPGAPPSDCGMQSGSTGPYTTVDQASVVIEKPYIIADGDSYKLMIPKLEKNKVGTTPGWQNAEEVDFNQVYVAKETDTAAIINAKLDEGLHLLIQPGQYHLEDSIKVTKANTVVLGMGLATLIPTNGTPAIEVANVDGVKVSGLLLQAGAGASTSLLQFGEKGYAGNPENPGAIHDIFARVGGTNTAGDMKTETMVEVNSGNTIIDDVWLWRADHQIDGQVVKDSRNPVDTGLQVNGDNVVGYGLACEHTLGNLLEWNGENGKSYFYQSEFPYDVTQENYGDKGFAAYKVADNVTNHEAYGVGAYSFFRDYVVAQPDGIIAPETAGVTFTNSLSVFLNGNGQINHVIDEDGDTALQGHNVQYYCDFVGNTKAEAFLQ